MKIHEMYTEKKPVISFEIFPPKKDAAIETIYQTLEELKDVKPDFISVTYGAGGSGEVNKTLELAAKIKQDYGIESLHHLTCIMNDREQIHRILGEIQAQGVENILALRGDVPAGCTEFPNEFVYAKDLIAEIKARGGFSVGAACYPEGHIDMLAASENMEHLKEKEAAGADFFVSQLFFDNASFYRLVDDARNAGITAPITAGVMPILSRGQVEKMIFMCGTSLPSELIKIIHKYEHDVEDLRKAGLEYALKQMDDLVAQGVDGIHIYTMNRPVVAKNAMARFGGVSK